MRIPMLVPAAALALAPMRLPAQVTPPLRDTTAYTTAATALHAQPDSASRVLVHLPSGWPLRVSSCAAGWCSARTESQSGYVPADLLTLTVPRGAAEFSAASVAPGTSIGVDLSTRLTLGFAAGRKLRVVPEIGYVSQHSKEYGSNTQISSYEIDGSGTELWLGLGFYWVRPLPIRPLGAPCLFYIGPRLGIAAVSAEAKVSNPSVPSDAQSSETDFWAGAAMGGELLVSHSFSVGAEARVTKVFPGSPRVTGVTPSSVGVGLSWTDFETRGTLVLRFYP